MFSFYSISEDGSDIHRFPYRKKTPPVLKTGPSVDCLEAQKQIESNRAEREDSDDVNDTTQECENDSNPKCGNTPQKEDKPEKKGYLNIKVQMYGIKKVCNVCPFWSSVCFG